MSNPRIDQKNKDETMRSILTVYTTSQALLLILFFGIAPYTLHKMRPDESMGVVELVLPLLTGYIGTILGYYFGSKAER
jgi:hypothetical protein